MFCHIGLQTTTAHDLPKFLEDETLEEHECGTCMMVLRAVRDVLNNTYLGRWIGRGGPTCLTSTLT
jgi:hypothetical protein